MTSWLDRRKPVVSFGSAAAVFGFEWSVRPAMVETGKKVGDEDHRQGPILYLARHRSHVVWQQVTLSLFGPTRRPLVKSCSRWTFSSRQACLGR
jgi:hypothetical protein